MIQLSYKKKVYFNRIGPVAAKLTRRDAHTWRSHARPRGHVDAYVDARAVGLAFDGPTS